MRKPVFLIIGLMLPGLGTQAQDTLELKLDQVIALAREQSPDAQAALNRLKNSYWQFETYQSRKLPELSLRSTLPDFNRTIDEVTQPNGTDRFVERQQASYSTQLSLSQDIPFTGGNISLNSGLRRIDIFGDNSSQSYLSTPVSIGYRQPIFAFNNYKWDDKIQPLKFREAKRQYLQSMEDVAVKAVDLFFNVYSSRMEIAISERNKANKDTLYRIARGRYDMGEVSENKLLQMELSKLNADLSVEESRLSYQNNKSRLKSFLNLSENVALKLVSPEKPETFKISEEKALTKAQQNRQETLQFQRQLLEAERDVAKAKKNSGLRNTELFAQYGLSNDANQFSNVYTQPEGQQRLQLGFSLPILDWGRTKAQRRMAQANQELVKTNVKQQKIDFRQQVKLTVQEFNMQAKQLKIADKANKIGQKRYQVTKNRFKIGKVDITDLNLAATERDKAKRSFIQSLRNFWTTRYKMRKLTLYNFLENQPIPFPEGKIEGEDIQSQE